GIEFSSFVRIAVDPAFNSAVNAFEPDGLRASPAAPYTSEKRGDVEQSETETGDEEKREPDVLCSECESEQVELALGEVQENRGSAVDLDPGKSDVDDDQQRETQFPPAGETSANIGGM